MPARRRRRPSVVVASAAAVLALSGCVEFSNAFWQCRATRDDSSEACRTVERYLSTDPDDPDEDGWRRGQDHCPYEQGLQGLNGCPDGDADGLADKDDLCPAVPGEPGRQGCPPPEPPREQFFGPPASDSPGEPPPPEEDTTAPATPTGLTATATIDRVTLDWADNSESDLRGYHVERATGETGAFQRLTTTPIEASEYADESVELSTTYRYVVRAVDSAGNISEPSDQAVVMSCPSPDCLGRRVTARAATLAYRAEISGRVARKGTIRAAGGVATITGLVFAGTLRVPRAPAALRRAAWKGRMTMTLDPSADRVGAAGVIVARFPRAGRVCLRVQQEFTVDADGRHRTRGTLAVIGAKGRARRLGFAGRFSGTPADGGAWRLRASATGRRRLPRALPRRCRI